MGRRAIGTLMLLATLSVIGVVVIQLLWLREASRYRSEQVELNQEQAIQLEKQFNDRVVIALTDVTEQILSITKDPTDLYDAVKQERPNYFAVTINDTLHPYLLEALLKKEFSGGTSRRISSTASTIASRTASYMATMWQHG
jgi:two-component system phosphate regulon sensor histidine kinase PhoR